MEIDLFTLIFQIINFIVLVILLKIFLFGRIVKAMDKREENIQSRINEAEKNKKEAKKEAEEQEKIKAELEKSKDEKLKEAEKEAESKRKDMLKKAREEVEGEKSKWIKSLEKQKSDFLKELETKSGDLVFDVAGKALRDLADAELENQIVRKFSEEIGSLGKEKKREIDSIFKKSDQGIVVFNSFDLSKKTKEEVVKTIKENFGKDMKLEFKKSSEVVCGIELRAGGRKIGWSLGSYLRDVREIIGTAFEDERSKETEKEDKDKDEDKDQK